MSNGQPAIMAPPGSAIMVNPYDVVVDVIHAADMDEAYGTYAADDE